MTTDRVAGAALVVFGLGVLWESRKLPLGSIRNPGPAYMPVLLALLVVIFGALIFALGRGAPEIAGVGWSEWRHAVAILLACAFAAVALERLGYRVTMVVLLLALTGGLERKGLLVSIAVSVGLSAASFYLFSTLLRVPLPRGPFGL